MTDNRGRESASKTRKTVAAACAAALVCALAAGAAVLAGSVEVVRTAAPEPEAQEPAQEDRKPDKAAKTPQELADEQLPQEARDAREAYGDAEREVVGILSGCVWTARTAGLALAFDDTTFTESYGGEAACTAYVVLAASAPETSSSDGVETTRRHFTVQTPSGTYMAALTTEAYSDDSASVTTLECDAFSRSGSWTAAARAESVVVEGPDEAWYAQNGTTSQALVDAFDAFVGASWPTVSRAVWDGTVSYDYSRGAAVLPFRLDDAARIRVQAVLDLATGAFAVEVV